MQSLMLALLLSATCLTAIADTPKPASIKVPTVPARTEDVSTLDGIIKAFYEVVTLKAGEPFDWGRDRSLYIPNVRFVVPRPSKAGKVEMQIQSHQDYVDRLGKISTTTFSEKEIHRVTQQFGAITHAWSTYEMADTEGGKTSVRRGINSIELFFDGTRYWISSVQWFNESPEMPIPPEYLGKR